MQQCVIKFNIDITRSYCAQSCFFDCVYIFAVTSRICGTLNCGQNNLKNDELNGWQILPWWSRFSCLTPLFVYWTVNFIFCLSKSNVNNTTQDTRIYPSHTTSSKTFILFFLSYVGECGKDKLGMTFWLSKPTGIHDTFTTFPLKFVNVFYCYSLFTPVCGINNLRTNYEQNQLTYLKILLLKLYYLCWRNILFQYLYLRHLHCADILSTLQRVYSHQVKARSKTTYLQNVRTTVGCSWANVYWLLWL